jgi:hypothetical protein
LRELHRLYAGRGLVVVGIHSPEFDHERDPTAVKQEIAKLQIPYLVALDTDFALWKGFGNRYWPATYLVGGTGRSSGSTWESCTRARPPGRKGPRRSRRRSGPA